MRKSLLPLRIVVMAACLLVASSCVRPQQVAATAPEEPPTDDFDAAGLVCELSGETVSDPGATPIGRRYTPSERERARIVLSRELRLIGLVPREHAYSDGRFVYYPEPERSWPTGNMSGVNLYAELPATVPSDEWIVVGAHYDTVETTPGADDNASGSVAVLSIARRLARLPVRRRNVMFAFFDQEEVVLVGSDRFAEMLVREGRRVVTFHNVDMVGWDGDGDRAVALIHGVESNPPIDDRYMRLYGRAATRMATRTDHPLLPMTIVREDSNRGEHVTFDMRGIDAVSLMQSAAERGDFNPHYHEPADTCDRIDSEYLEMCAELVALAVTEQLR